MPNTSVHKDSTEGTVCCRVLVDITKMAGWNDVRVIANTHKLIHGRVLKSWDEKSFSQDPKLNQSFILMHLVLTSAIWVFFFSDLLKLHGIQLLDVEPVNQ